MLPKDPPLWKQALRSYVCITCVEFDTLAALTFSQEALPVENGNGVRSQQPRLEHLPQRTKDRQCNHPLPLSLSPRTGKNKKCRGGAASKSGTYPSCGVTRASSAHHLHTFFFFSRRGPTSCVRLDLIDRASTDGLPKTRTTVGRRKQALASYARDLVPHHSRDHSACNSSAV